MQGSSYAPLQFLRSPWNRDVYTAIDNQVDGRTVLVLYLGAASTLPSELQKYNVGCILIHKDEKQIYLNTGSDTTPTWSSFGPGTNTLPTPFVTGQYLTNDGVDAFWSLIDLATGVTGLLDSDHIDLSDLANNSDFIDFLIANSYFTSSLANDSNFLTNLITNLNSAGTLAVVTDGVTITGDGTTGNPLVAVGGGSTLDVQENGVSVENPVDTINFVTNGGIVSTPLAGVVDVDLTSLLVGGGGTLLYSDTTQSTVTNSSNTYTTRYTIPIPAGTLGTKNVLRVSLLNTYFYGSSGTWNYGVRIKYGGTIVAELSSNNTGVLSPNQFIDIVGIIAADNSTGSQKSIFTATNEYITRTDGKSISVDSTIAQNLTIETCGQFGGSMTQTIEGVIVEKITSGGSTNYISDSLTAGQDLTAYTAAVIGDGSTNTIAQQTFSGIGVSFPVDMSVEKVSTQIDTSADSFVLSGFTFSNRGLSGALTGNIKVSLQTDNAGEASGTILTSVTIPFSTVNNLSSTSVTFTTPYTLQPSTTYWVVIEGVTASGIIDFSTALNAAATRHFYTGGVWTNSAYYIGSSLLAIFDGGKVYQASNSTGIGTFQAVPGFGGNAITNAPLINTLDGIVTSTVSVGNSVTLVTEGFLDGFTGLTAGTIYEVGANGTLSASGGKQIGKAITTTKVNIRQYQY